ncbi:hypothetical protein DL96DRAFT_1565197 [Flagelloscypha sp. PMI_526]|nr:hypothetical protein DL96DRAFT_1565197 [Flagelloscypha sp. PMI_526]
MSPPPNCGAGAQRLGLLPTDDGRNHAPPDKTIIGFLGQLDIAVAGTNMRQLLANELKDSAREVSDDLVAVTCPNGMALIPGPDAMARFWNVVLDIILEYKKKRRVFQCLAAILDKIHCTTNVLRRLSPVVDDFPEVEKLHQTVICLISCATPQPFLIICPQSNQQIVRQIPTNSCIYPKSNEIYADYRNMSDFSNVTLMREKLMPWAVQVHNSLKSSMHPSLKPREIFHLLFHEEESNGVSEGVTLFTLYWAHLHVSDNAMPSRSDKHFIT